MWPWRIEGNTNIKHDGPVLAWRGDYYKRLLGGTDGLDTNTLQLQIP